MDSEWLLFRHLSHASLAGGTTYLQWEKTIKRDVIKTICPLKCLFFVTDVLYNWIIQFKKVAQMYEENINFPNYYLNSFGRFVPGHLDIRP
mgnify:CR=1 FL=1